MPEGAWPLLLTMRSAIARDAPLIADPDARRALVLAAHPDDESLGCGGTIAVMRAHGAQVTVAYATDGEATIGATADRKTTGAARRAEAVRACAALGVEDVEFWELPDGGLAGDLPALSRNVTGAVARTDPDAIFVPWFFDGHHDHRALSEAVQATDPEAELWGYETWTALPANRMVDVTRVWDRKEAAIACHLTAAQAFDLRAGLGLNRWRSLHGLMGKGYAEGFLVGRAADWRDWQRPCS